MTLSQDRPGLAMAALGTAAVIAGGLVAAVTGPLALSRGSWAAAYLVLVCGVGQVAMAAARLLARTDLAAGARIGADHGGSPGSLGSTIAEEPAVSDRAPRLGWQQLATWNLANALVIAGTLASSPWVVDVGGLGCVAALVMAARHARALRAGLGTGAYRAVLALMAVSIPVGLLLSHLRNAR